MACAIENAIVDGIYKPLLILKLHSALQLIEYFSNLRNDVRLGTIQKDLRTGIRFHHCGREKSNGAFGIW